MVFMVISSQLPSAAILWIGFSLCLTFLLAVITKGNVHGKRKHQLYPHEYATLTDMRAKVF